MLGLQLFFGAGTFHPHLCFIDVNLPDGEGHDVAVELKERYPDTYLVCITANKELDQKQMCIYDHRIFHKPIDPDELIRITDTVRKYYFNPSTEDEEYVRGLDLDR